MTTEEIDQRRERELIKFDLAKQIRQLLDEAEKRYDALGGDWGGDDVQTSIVEMVTEE